MNAIDLTEKKIHLFQGEKNSMGRVVYLSHDALFALKRWLAVRNREEAFIFSGHHGPLCYSAARSRFVTYLRKARLEHKGYTVHCLRHSFASELLNAGMRLEVLQQLMGHQDIQALRETHRQDQGRRVLPGHGDHRERGDRWRVLRNTAHPSKERIAHRAR
jgi:integrase